VPSKNPQLTPINTKDEMGTVIHFPITRGQAKLVNLLKELLSVQEELAAANREHTKLLRRLRTLEYMASV